MTDQTKKWFMVLGAFYFVANIVCLIAYSINPQNYLTLCLIYAGSFVLWGMYVFVDDFWQDRKVKRENRRNSLIEEISYLSKEQIIAKMKSNQIKVK